jgi:hypothetical protein
VDLHQIIELPGKLGQMATHLSQTKIFRSGNLIWNEQGFHELSPMPSEEQLFDYYSKSYWASHHGGKAGFTEHAF